MLCLTSMGCFNMKNENENQIQNENENENEKGS